MARYAPHHERWRLVTALAAAQHGLVSTRQLRELGMSAVAANALVKHHRLTPLRLGVYAVAGTPTSRWTALMAAYLAAAPLAAASFRSAAELYALPSVAPPPHPEITVYGACSRRLSDICAHRSDCVDRSDLAVRHNIPVTSPARTLVDLGRYLSRWMLAKTYNHILRTQLATVDDVDACLERVGGRGRPGTTWLRILTAERRLGFHPGDNDFELVVVQALRRAGVPVGVQQFQVTVGRSFYVFDLAWPDAMVAVEIDGSIHLEELVADHDVEKRNRLTAQGWQIFLARRNTNLNELATQLLGALNSA